MADGGQNADDIDETSCYEEQKEGEEDEIEDEEDQYLDDGDNFEEEEDDKAIEDETYSDNWLIWSKSERKYESASCDDKLVRS